MADELPIVFTRHALIKLAQRNLTKEMVVRVLERPAHIVVAGDQIHAYGRFGRLYLKVAFARTSDCILVITQHFVTSLP